MNTIRRCLIASSLCLGVALLAASPAWAQTYTNVAPPTVGRSLSGTGTAAGPTPVVQALATQATAGSAVSGTEVGESGLAFTGADVATLVLTAATLIGVGLVLARRARPRAVVES